MFILTILAGISNAAYLCETIDGGNFTQNGQWPDRPGQLKYPHLGGYWNIKAVDHTQVKGFKGEQNSEKFLYEYLWFVFRLKEIHSKIEHMLMKLNGLHLNIEPVCPLGELSYRPSGLFNQKNIGSHSKVISIYLTVCLLFHCLLYYLYILL